LDVITSEEFLCVIVTTSSSAKIDSMKKILCAVAVLASINTLHAQEPADALRYSWYAPGGSARTQAVGGAMGSLGGDITATFVNPAGLAFYRTGDFVLSPAFKFGNAKASYLNRTEKEKASKFTWGTTGFVIGGGDGKGNVRNAAFSLGYNRTADFNSKVLYRGQNNQSSFSQKYLEEIARNGDKDANVVSSSLDPNDPRFNYNYTLGTSLAFNTFWIDTVGGSTNGNFQFQSRSANMLSSGLLQQNTVTTSGGIDEIALGLAANIKDKLMFGGSFGVPILHYKKDAEFIEADPSTNFNNHFNYGMFNETLTTTGVGINLKLGAIYKPAEFWRLGLAIHTPTLYTLTDKFESSVTADVEDGHGASTDYSKDYSNGEASKFKYTYVSPYRVIGSISYVIREIQDVTKQRGFLTADVEYVNYKASSYSPDDEANTDEGTKTYLKQLNNAIDEAYKGAFNFRVGGELKFTTVMFRLGAAYYGNPYQDIHGEKGSKLNLSGGLGYRNKGVFVDLTYVHAITKDVQFAYRLANAPYFGANVKNSANNILLTIGFKI
jgi:hypothetical protein